MQEKAVRNASSKGVAVIRNIGVIGSRSLPFEYADKVGNLVDDLVARGFHIASGGAIGADQYCLERVVSSHSADKCTIFSAWQNYAGFPVKVRPYVREARSAGASIMWGFAQGKEPHSIIRLALLKRNEKLVQACYGILAFLMPGSRGTLYTITKAIQSRLPVVIVPIGTELPSFPNIKWVALRCGGVWEGAFKSVYLQ